MLTLLQDSAKNSADNSNDSNDKKFGQIIPFDFDPSDFVRDKPPALPKKSNDNEMQRDARAILDENMRSVEKNLKIDEKKKKQEEKYKLFDDDNARPTGYDNYEDEDEE